VSPFLLDAAAELAVDLEPGSRPWRPGDWGMQFMLHSSGLFQWSPDCTLLSSMPRQLSLSLSSTSAPASKLQPTTSAFSHPVSTTIPDLTILEFIFGTTKLRKQLYKNLKYDT
jgi:hypothetical protein